MNHVRSARLKQIIDAARDSEGEQGVDTMVVSGHLAQMRMFMLRQGVEFYAKQDTFGFRNTFLANLIEENEVDARLEGIVNDFLCDGKGLWFFRPIGEGYRILWFPKNDYRAYYGNEVEIDRLELRYKFQVREGGLGFGAPGPEGSTERWVKLIVRKDTITETISTARPEFDNGILGQFADSGKTRTVRNSLGFVPAVEAFCNMKSNGMDAQGDFDWMGGHIVNHDKLAMNIRKNINYFGNPTMLSSRPKEDLVSWGDSIADIRPTIASQAGFSSAGRPASRVSMPTGSGGEGEKIARLIANLQPTDRVNYISPDAVSGDQNLYTRQYREEIRTALGGVDELGVSSGATAYEIKSLFGRAATTAARKCRGLITYGLCKLLSLIILNEERVFRDSFAAALKMKRPVAPIKEESQDPRKFEKAVQEFNAAMEKFKAQIEAKITAAVQAEVLPQGVIGLLPDGDRRVEWRWRGPVFEESADDILNNSIVVRNLQELGVNSIQALRHLFPDKTDEERGAMLSGYPFRMAQATQSSIGTFLSLIAQMRQTPHPQAPNLPLLADPKLDLTPYLYRALDFLKTELTYAGHYRDATGTGDPASLDALERQRAERGLPVGSSADRQPPTFVPDGWSSGIPGSGGSYTGTLPFSSGPSGAAGGPMANGVPGSYRIAERDAELPIPGTLLANDPSAPVSSASARGPMGTSAGGPGGQLPDSLTAQLDSFGTGRALAGAAERTRKRRVPQRAQ
jgi:hypothetical protein